MFRLIDADKAKANEMFFVFRFSSFFSLIRACDCLSYRNKESSIDLEMEES